ncbi:leucine-rich repeat domain-containing protein [Chitinophaga qingshengii]|uniref:Leucine-rich repeat domain-containing protein n=1 Tax=Chitinophaga qingshengii TaxID=1569794 RepID=A0ABR7TT43_9BACT|nr:leucine-rich repeat domain-containing protein [Chitinophaga qingshengii]MBC9932139.1 leucine-rich repeat domain-containing protein [Chitinophaga qingshengii]
MSINLIGKLILSSTPRWLMAQTLHTAEKERGERHKGRGLEWGVVEKNKLADIDFLVLWPDDKSTTEIPPVVATLPNLKTLNIPSWFVPHLKAADLPPSLEELQIGVGGEKDPKVNWDKALVLKHIKLLDLTAVVSDFYAEGFPGLSNSLSITLGNKKLDPAEIGKCKHLKNLWLYKADTVEVLSKAGTDSLHFVGWLDGKHEDFKGIKGYGGVQDALIKWNKKLTSLEGLEHLPKLEKLDMLGCSKLEHLGDIMKIKSLQWFRIMECGKAWTAHIDEITDKFTKAGFEKVRFEPDGNYSLLEVWRKYPPAK